MRTYCFKCRLCEARITANSPQQSYCPECEQFDCVVRDFKSESVGLNISELRKARD